MDGTEAVAVRNAGSLVGTRWIAPALVALTVCLVAVPILLATVPPVMDFPNHLTRIWLLAGGAQQQPLSSMYEVRWWQTSTNLAVDFAGSELVRVAGLNVATKSLLFAMLVGPALGSVFLNRAIFGRFSIWQLAAVLLVWSTTAVEGFLSFQVGIAAGLFCAVAVRPLLNRLSFKRLAAITLCAVGLLLVHPFAIVMFLGATAGLALGERIPWRRQSLQARAVRIALLTAACVIPFVALYLFASRPPGAYNEGSNLVHWNPISETIKPKHLALLYASPFISYRLLWDLIATVPVIALVVWAAVTRRIRVHAGLLVVAAGWMAIAVFLPTNIGDGGALPVRFPIMALLLALAGTDIAFQTRPARLVFAAVLTAVAVFRVGSETWVWHQRAHDVEQLRMAAQEIPPGSAVMVLQQKWDKNGMGKAPLGRLVAGCPGNVCAAERHFGSLIVMWRQAFIPMLFTVPGQHPLGVRPPWTKIAVHASGVPFADELAPRKERDKYLAQWWRKFDYVLLLDADLGQTPIPHTQLVSDTGFARVYKVSPGPGMALLAPARTLRFAPR